MIMAPRLVYGMAAQGILPTALGGVHSDRRTPWVAIPFTTALATLLISSDDGHLTDTTVILLLMVFVVVNNAVLVLRRDPVEHRHYQAPTVLPALGAVRCVVLLINKAVDDITVYGYASGCGARRGAMGHQPCRQRPHHEIDPAKLVDETHRHPICSTGEWPGAPAPVDRWRRRRRAAQSRDYAYAFGHTPAPALNDGPTVPRNADERTRTSTSVSSRRPERRASANSATSAGQREP
jgi:amino acid permease-like protein